MKRIDTATAAVDLFGAGKNGYRDGNKALGVAPTDLNASVFNAFQEELANIVEQAGFALNANDNTQVAKAIQSGKLNSCSAGGTADALTGSLSLAVTALSGGMLFSVRASMANTTATPTFTPNVGTIAAKQIVKGAGSALVAGDIAGSGHWLELQYDSTLDKWVLLNPATGLSSVTTSTAVGSASNLKVAAPGTSANTTLTADEIVLGDGAGGYKTLRNVNLTIAGTAVGANGLDTGVLAASTWYSVWVIAKADGTVSGLLSLSSSAPTMPAGYTYKARVSWVRTDATNKYPYSFIQNGRRAAWKLASGSNLTSLFALASGASSGGTWAAASVSAFVPPSAISIKVELALMISTNAGAVYSNVAPNNSYSYGAISSGVGAPLQIASTNLPQGNALSGDIVLESTNLYYASNHANSGLYALGWEDNQ